MSLIPLQNTTLQALAFTHRSALNEVDGTEASNERLEFLGDAVLELATSRYLFDRFPKDPEGVLTHYRSSLVKTTTLARVARSLNLGELVTMSKGEEGSGGRENDSLLADTFEAYLGALYLEQGFEIVATFLQTSLFPLLDELRSTQQVKDPKSRLQEELQAKRRTVPHYTVVQESGPDHLKTFTVAVSIGGKTIAKGEGKNKQDAQQRAAEKALEILKKS